MEYVYAAMLLHSAKQQVNEHNVKKVLEAAGVKADDGRVKALVAALDGVDIEAAIKEAAVPMMAAPAAAAGAAAAEEQSTFTVELTSAGESKINAIKAVREVTGLGLKEAKDIVDAAPKAVKEGASKAEAEDMKAKLEAAGATVTLK